jgi:hypothetical protein
MIGRQTDGRSAGYSPLRSHLDYTQSLLTPQGVQLSEGLSRKVRIIQALARRLELVYEAGDFGACPRERLIRSTNRP